MARTEAGPYIAAGRIPEVPGRQTVPRTEVQGAVHSMHLCADAHRISPLIRTGCDRESPVRAVIDASYVVNNWSKASVRDGTNQDLWRSHDAATALLDAQGVEVRPLKIVSHQDRKGVTLSQDPIELYCNVAADCFAWSRA